MQTKPVIKLDEIHKVYHTGEVDVHAVRGITLEIFPGEFVALMGASGSVESSLAAPQSFPLRAAEMNEDN